MILFIFVFLEVLVRYWSIEPWKKKSLWLVMYFLSCGQLKLLSIPLLIEGGAYWMTWIRERNFPSLECFIATTVVSWFVIWCLPQTLIPFKILVWNEDLTECSETLFKGKAKVARCVLCRLLNKTVGISLLYLNCLFQVIWWFFAKSVVLISHQYPHHL